MDTETVAQRVAENEAGERANELDPRGQLDPMTYAVSYRSGRAMVKLRSWCPAASEPLESPFHEWSRAAGALSVSAPTLPLAFPPQPLRHPS